MPTQFQYAKNRLKLLADDPKLWGFVTLLIASTALTAKISFQLAVVCLGVSWLLAIFIFYENFENGPRKWLKVIGCSSVLGAALGLFGIFISPNPETLDGLIAVNCDSSTPPDSFDNSEAINVFELGAPPNYYGMPGPAAGAQTAFMLGDGPIRWLPKPGEDSFSKCIISNYSNISLINVSLKMPAIFRPVLIIGNGYKGGPPVNGRYVFSPLLDLGPASGTNSSAYFYIWNHTNYFADALIPAVIELSTSGSSKREIVKLIPPRFPGWANMQPNTMPVAAKGSQK